MSKEKKIGSQALAADIMRRLEIFGIKKSTKCATMYDALDAVIGLAEFYKRKYESILSQNKQLKTGDDK